jgi:drug/metabolite transporter (DMT)-like permease
LLYVSVISTFVGFIPWYRGLALAGTARASQTQLLQPFLTVAWAMLLLGERPGVATPIAALLVCVCMATSVRARFVRKPALPAVTGSDRQGGVA